MALSGAWLIALALADNKSMNQLVEDSDSIRAIVFLLSITVCKRNASFTVANQPATNHPGALITRRRFFSCA